MLALDAPQWSELRDAYGSSSRIPELLKYAEALPEQTLPNTEPYFSLWSALCHQGDVYSASYAAVPHLVRIVEANPSRFRWTMLLLVHAIEVARAEGRGPELPADLALDYQNALKRVPDFASALLAQELDETELRVVLAACASAKGFASIGEVLAELTPDNTARFLSDWRYI